MARTAVKVNREALEDAIKQAESGKTYSTLGELWETVASIYNSNVKSSVSTDANVKTAKPLTASVVMLRVKEWGIPIKTKPGKKGRGRKANANPDCVSNVLCVLADWTTETVSKGRFMGQETTKRLVISADKYSWSYGREAKGSPVLHDAKYHGEFRTMFMSMNTGYNIEKYGVNWKEAAKLVVAELSKRLNIPPLKITSDDPATVGHAIDEHYRVNYHRDDVLKKVFQTESTDEEAA